MKKEKNTCLIMIILALCVIFPMINQGIMCNDELLSRIWAQKGLLNFFQVTIFNENIAKGRILGVLGNFKFLSYISENKYIFRTIGITFLLIALALFVYLIYKMFSNLNFAILVGILILVFYPITFEFATPNAFLIVCLQPLIWLEVSLLFYLKYIENNKKKDLIFSMAFFMWSMFLYEFLITYVLLYTMIYIIKYCGEEKWLKRAIKKTLPFYGTAIVYLILYIGQGFIFPTNYAGNKLGIESIGAVLGVLKTLFLSALPGYYTIFNDKYNFLFQQYNNGEMTWDNFMNPVIIIFILSLFYILTKIFCGDIIKKQVTRKDVMILLATLLYGVLPALPNAVSTMYQNSVTDESFTSLPVSIFLYFSIMLMLAYAIWISGYFIRHKGYYIILIVLIVVGASNVQVRNHVFSEEQARNFARIETIENLFELDYWKQFGEIVLVEAPSLFKVKNSLAVEDTHWTEYSSIYGNNVMVLKEYDYPHMYLEMQDDNSFYLYWDNLNYYITPNKTKGNLCLKDIEQNLLLFHVDGLIYEEKNYKVYSLGKY